MQNSKKRFLISLSAIVTIALMGMLGGYLVGRSLILRNFQARLGDYANRTLNEGEASSAELRTVLEAANASPHPRCSAAEIGYFRTLIFESEYAKDVGRLRGDGTVLCSATLGMVQRPAATRDPDFRQQDGTSLYTDLVPYGDSDRTTIALQSQDSYVVFTPLTRLHPEPPPMHFTETAVDAPTEKFGRLFGETPGFQGSFLREESSGQINRSLYATVCSIRFFNCITAYTSIPEVMAAGKRQVAIYMAGGALAGTLLGLLGSLLYRRNRSLELQLRRAIHKDRFRVVYQPIADLATRRLAGAEALARWTDEDGNAVGPDVFVRLAERQGFVGEITRLVVRHVIREMGKLLRSPSGFRVSINITAADLNDPDFPDWLETALRDSSIAADRLSLEITESSTVCENVAKEAIVTLRRRGHSIHIDDFGTGYSSLSYLHDLCVDAIKIDRSFTQSIGTGSVVGSILPQILAMADTLKLQVIVEGVETDGQATYFAETERPVFAQGWLFGKPMPAGELCDLLSRTGTFKPPTASTPATTYA